MLTIEHIREVEKLTIGKPYPFYAHQLRKVGFEKYEVTVKNHNRTFTYNINEDIFVPGHFEEDLQCADTFELSAVVAAIKNNQDGNTDYSKFLEEIAHAGVHSYVADLTEMQIIYNGKKVGELYAEPIPSI
ncbi:MAG: DUF1398 domain-containing protein [Chitinophagaceae bacterium]|nr:MAG: DUF1398 domain-containing protein [Chitinophagaceae bacterium]